MTALFCTVMSSFLIWAGWELNECYQTWKSEREVEKFLRAQKRRERMMREIAREFGLKRK